MRDFIRVGEDDGGFKAKADEIFRDGVARRIGNFKRHGRAGEGCAGRKAKGAGQDEKNFLKENWWTCLSQVVILA